MNYLKGSNYQEEKFETALFLIGRDRDRDRDRDKSNCMERIKRCLRTIFFTQASEISKEGGRGRSWFSGIKTTTKMRRAL